jgi:undecaprenyl-diphosphatase
MPLWQAVVLAVAQGLSEFLPISSTAHLTLIPWLLRFQDPGLTFDVALHVGTLVAVLVYFFRTWVDLLLLGLGRNPIFASLVHSPEESASGARSPYRKLFWLLVIATIPGAVAGWALHEQVATVFRHPAVVGSALILLAIPLAWAERIGRLEKDLRGVGLADSLWIGLAQALALIPGVSRSGATMTAALFLHFRRDAAARFSFLLSTPIIAGAALIEGVGLARNGLPSGMEVPFFVGVLVSAVSGYLCIAWFLRFLQFGTFKIFVYYRIILGIIVLALALFTELGNVV